MTEKKKELALSASGGLVLKSLEEAFRFSEFVAGSALCPQSLRGKPGDVLLAMQYGVELGLAPMKAIQSVNVINGRPSLSVAAQLALAQGSGQMVSYLIEFDGEEFDDDFVAIVTSRRKGRDESVTSTFSVADAKRAKLWGRAGPWTTYPRDMLAARAKARNLGENFADIVGGYATEVVRDIPAGPIARMETHEEGATVVVVREPDPLLKALEGAK